MKAFTLLGRSLVDLSESVAATAFNNSTSSGRSFNKRKALPENLTSTLFAECLHRIKYSVTFCMPFPNAHRNTSCRMHQQRPLAFLLLSAVTNLLKHHLSKIRYTILHLWRLPVNLLYIQLLLSRLKYGQIPWSGYIPVQCVKPLR